MTDQNDMPQGEEPRRQYTEEFRVSGERVLAKVKELVHEGNVRRIIIKNDDGKVLIEIPLTIGVIGTVLLPVWAAIGAIAALAANLTIAVDRVDGPTAAGAQDQAAATQSQPGGHAGADPAPAARSSMPAPPATGATHGEES